MTTQEVFDEMERLKDGPDDDERWGCDGHWWIGINKFDGVIHYTYEYECCDWEECNNGDWESFKNIDDPKDRLEYMMTCDWDKL